MTPIIGILASSMTAGQLGSYESIATASPSGVNTVTISNIPDTYKHLQIRYIGQSARGTYAQDALGIRFNSDSGNNYSHHILRANEVSASGLVTGSGSSQSGINCDYGTLGATGGSSLYWGIGVIDILDYTSTNKNKTVRMIAGTDSAGTVGGVYSTVGIISGCWQNTVSAISSITLYTAATGSNFNSGTNFCLYGIKG